MRQLTILSRSLCATLCILATHCAIAENLQQAWDAAIAADPQLKATRSSTAAAMDSLSAAKSARLPNVALEGGHTTLSTTPAITFGGAEVPFSQRNSSTYRVTAALPLYTGGRLSEAVAAAGSVADASALAEKSAAQDLKLRVAEAYVAVLRANRGVRLAQKHADSLQAHARDVSQLREQGMAVKSAELSVQVSQLEARQKLLQAANALELSRAAYNRLLGRPLDQLVDLEDISPRGRDASAEELASRALTQRSELEVMELQVDALRHQARAIAGASRPQVGLTADYGRMQDRYLSEDRGWAVSLGVRWNVFDGGLTRASASAVDHQAASLADQREDLRSAIRLQVRQAWLDVQASNAQLSVTEAAVTQADENLRVARDRYSNGLASHTEVLDAEALRVAAETQDASSHFDAVLNELRLERAAGDL